MRLIRKWGYWGQERKGSVMRSIRWMLLAAMVLGVSVRGVADRRSYAFNYEYLTVPAGLNELEYYMTVAVPSKDSKELNSWEHQIELEHGLTDSWDVSIYQKFKQTNAGDESKFAYGGFKLRTRYAIGEEGEYPLDSLLYVEYIRNDDLGAADVLEGKLILAKRIDSYNFAYNHIIEQELDYKGETENRFSLGAGLDLNSALFVGLECKGDYEGKAVGIGPTISLLADREYITLGSLFSVTEEAKDVVVRMVIGIPL